MSKKKTASRPVKTSVLIPDGETHLLIYAINCLSQTSGISIFVMSSSKWNPVRFSRHISEFIYFEKTDNDHVWVQQINTLVKKHDIDIIMPIFEKGIKKILENKKLLDTQSRLVPLPNLKTFNTAINKWELANYCIQNEIPVPKSFLFHPTTQLDASFFEEMQFPVIVKPLEGFGGGMGIAVFDNIKDITQYLSNIKDYSIIIQEFIKGYDIDCSILAVKGTIKAYTIQKGFLQGKSPCSFRSSL